MLKASARKLIESGHINNPLDSAVWAELNNCSGMQSIIINFYSIIDFHFKFQSTEESVLRLKIIYSWHHQLEKAGDFSS